MGEETGSGAEEVLGLAREEVEWIQAVGIPIREKINATTVGRLSQAELTALDRGLANVSSGAKLRPGSDAFEPWIVQLKSVGGVSKSSQQAEKAANESNHRMGMTVNRIRGLLLEHPLDNPEKRRMSAAELQIELRKNLVTLQALYAKGSSQVPTTTHSGVPTPGCQLAESLRSGGGGDPGASAVAGRRDVRGRSEAGAGVRPAESVGADREARGLGSGRRLSGQVSQAADALVALAQLS